MTAKTNQYVTRFVSGAEFKARTGSIISTFKRRTITYFTNLLVSARIIVSANGIQSNLTYQSVFVNDSWRGYRYSPSPAMLGQCKCSVAFDCLEERGLIWCAYGNNCTVGRTAWATPGLFRSCTSLDRVFHSDLRCFFNQTCVDTLVSLYNYDMPTRLPLPEATMGIRAMNSSVPSRFAPTDTMDTLFNDFLIEEWNIEDDFVIL
jgi:hypothetical protein